MNVARREAEWTQSTCMEKTGVAERDLQPIAEGLEEISIVQGLIVCKSFIDSVQYKEVVQMEVVLYVPHNNFLSKTSSLLLFFHEIKMSWYLFSIFDLNSLFIFNFFGGN